MYLEQLKYFHALADTGSIKAAAQRLHISRPAVSIALKNLEEELGFPLCIKKHGGIMLTQEGSAVLESVRIILQQIERIHAVRQTPTGTFSICATPIISNYLTGHIFIDFKKKHENINIIFNNTLTTEVFSRLRKEGDHIAVSGAAIGLDIQKEAASRGYECALLYTDERRLFLSGNHPLAHKKKLIPEDLKTLPLACYSPAGDHFSQHYLPYFAYAYRLANRGDLLEIALANEAALIQPFRMFRHNLHVRRGQLVEKELPIRDMDHSVPVVAIRLPELPPAEQVFWEYLISSFTRFL